MHKHIEIYMVEKLLEYHNKLPIYL